MEVIFVHVALDRGRVGVVVQQLVGEVLDNHGRDPLSGVHSTVPDDRRTSARACRAVDLNSGDCTTFNGCA